MVASTIGWACKAQDILRHRSAIESPAIRVSRIQNKRKDKPAGDSKSENSRKLEQGGIKLKTSLQVRFRLRFLGTSNRKDL